MTLKLAAHMHEIYAAMNGINYMNTNANEMIIAKTKL